MITPHSLARGAVAGPSRRRLPQARKPGTDLDLRGDDGQHPPRPRVAPDGAVPQRRVRDHRDGQEQRKNTAGDLRLAARVGRPVPGTHGPVSLGVSGPSWASPRSRLPKGCSHCSSPAFTAGVVVRAARWSRAVSQGRAARSSKTASIAATRLRMPSQAPRPRPREKSREEVARKGARLLVRPLRRVRGTEKTRDLAARL